MTESFAAVRSSAGSTTRRDLKEAWQDLQAWLQRWEQRYPRLTAWVEAQIGETLKFYRLLRQHADLPNLTYTAGEPSVLRDMVGG